MNFTQFNHREYFHYYFLDFLPFTSSFRDPTVVLKKTYNFESGLEDFQFVFISNTFFYQSQTNPWFFKNFFNPLCFFHSFPY